MILNILKITLRIIKIIIIVIIQFLKRKIQSKKKTMIFFNSFNKIKQLKRITLFKRKKLVMNMKDKVIYKN